MVHFSVVDGQNLAIFGEKTRKNTQNLIKRHVFIDNRLKKKTIHVKKRNLDLNSDWNSDSNLKP